MSKMSWPAIITAVIFIFVGTFAIGRFIHVEGPMTFAVDAGTGALSAIIGAAIGMILFPKKGEKND